MSVYTKPNSPYWQFDFQLKGNRYYGTLADEAGRPLRTSEPKRRAEAREAVLRERAREQLASGRKREHMTLDVAIGKYYTEHAQYLPSAQNVLDYAENWRRIGARRRPLSILKKNLHQFSDADAAWFVAQRRGEKSRHSGELIARRTVNADVEFIRAVFNRAADIWGVDIGDPALNWNKHLLETVDPPTRVLTSQEDVDLFAKVVELRPDFGDFLEFAVLSGWRLSEIIELEKRKVDRNGMAARVVLKGGEEVLRPLTDEMLAIVVRNWMSHPNRVFTYVCQRNSTWADAAGVRQVQRKGQRYPFTYDGWRKQFYEILEAAGVEDFRFHDFRHTLGTRVYLATRDKLVTQRVLAHKDPASTERYIHAADALTREALASGSRDRVPNKSLTEGTGQKKSEGEAEG